MTFATKIVCRSDYNVLFNMVLFASCVDPGHLYDKKTCDIVFVVWVHSITNYQRMHTRVTVVVLCVCMSVSLSITALVPIHTSFIRWCYRGVFFVSCGFC